MAKYLTLIILYNGTPVEGATVTFGEYLEKSKTTNASGEITGSFADDFSIVGAVAMELPSGVMRISGPMLLEAGETYEINIRE